MASKNVVAAVLAIQLLAGLSHAQEYGRASGGEISVLSKQSRRFSGSIGLSTSLAGGSFGGSTGAGWDATLGGTAVEDRLWFFASAQQREPVIAAAFPQESAIGPVRTLDAKATAQLGSHNSLVSSFGSARLDGLTAPGWMSAPRSFLSLHYTGIVSSNMFVTGSVSRSSGARVPDPLP